MLLFDVMLDAFTFDCLIIIDINAYRVPYFWTNFDVLW